MGDEADKYSIEAVFFPLLAVLLPKWIKNCDPLKNKIIFIISGRGTPTDSKTRMIDNSTKYTGVLITKFIDREYPNIKVIHVHSATNIFRYDENIAFVKRELLPMIDEIRYVCVYVYIYIFMYIYIYVCMYLYVYIYIYIYMYKRISVQI
jgi:hypothetical protein